MYKKSEFKQKECEVKQLIEENRIMMADLSIMDLLVTKTWFEKNKR
jgi:hypothetical protein